MSLSALEEAPLNFITNSYGDVYLHEVNGGAFNQLGAQVVFAQQFSDRLLKKDAFYLIVGSDSGLLIRYLLSCGIPNNSFYCFVEDAQVLAALQSCPEPLPTHENITVVSESEWLGCAKQNRLIESLILTEVHVIKSLSVLDAHNAQYPILFNKVDAELRQLRWSLQSEICTQSFFENQLANLCENRIPASALRGAFTGKTAVVLAGGPSLDAILPWVVEHRASLFVAAVSRIARRLQQVNIVPDLFVSIDPTDKMFTVSREMFAFTDVLLAQAYHVTPLISGNWPGPQVYLGKRFPWVSELNCDNISVNGPTVTNAALFLLLQMQFKTIYLAGVDLAYNTQGFSHAKGSAEHDAGPLIDFEGQSVLLNNGESSETDAAFFDAIDMLSEQAKAAKELGCTLINLSETAAHVKGISFAAPETITAPCEPLQSQAILKSCYDDAVAQHRDAGFDVIVRELEHMLYRLDKVSMLASEVVALHDKSSAKNNLKIEKLDKQLNKDYSDVITVLKTYCLKIFKNLYRRYDLGDQTDVFAVSRDLFVAYVKASGQLKISISEALERVRRRIDAARSENLHEVIAGWQADRQGLRAQIWKWSHRAEFLNLSEDLKTGMRTCEKEFEKMINQKTQERAQVKSKNWRVVQNKLSKAYYQKDAEKVKQIYYQISCIDSEEANNLSQLALGFVAELVDEPGEAIQYYHQAMTGGCAELALNRLASLLMNLKSIENVALVLQCLVDISPGYLPQHAAMQRILGNYESAIESYKKYLTFSPNNYIVKLKLGLTYKELGEAKLAQQLLDEVAVHAPHLDVAQEKLDIS